MGFKHALSVKNLQVPPFPRSPSRWTVWVHPDSDKSIPRGSFKIYASKIFDSWPARKQAVVRTFGHLDLRLTFVRIGKKETILKGSHD
jgi:hypothetical protein